MFKSILRFVGLCLFLVITSGNVLADTLPSTDPCYNKTYVGPGGGNISCNEYTSGWGKCYMVSANKCEFWCSTKNRFRLAYTDDTTNSSASEITTSSKWTCMTGYYFESRISCGTEATSTDGQTYYKNESYLDCRLKAYMGSSYPLAGGVSSDDAYLVFKLDPNMTFCQDCSSYGSYGFDVKANKPWNAYYAHTYYPYWILASRDYKCAAGYRVNSGARQCYDGDGDVGRIRSDDVCTTRDSDLYTSYPNCAVCPDGTYRSSPSSSTSCTSVPANSTSSSDRTDFLCNAGYYRCASNICCFCPWKGDGSSDGVTSTAGATNVSQCYYLGSSAGSQTDGTGTYTQGGTCNFDMSASSRINMYVLFQNCNDLDALIKGSGGGCERYCTAIGAMYDGWGACVNNCKGFISSVCPMSNNNTNMYCGLTTDPVEEGSAVLFNGIMQNLPAGMNCYSTSVSYAY